MNKKTINVIVYSAVGLIILLVLLYKFLPADIITKIAGENNAASNILCAVPVQVAGDSMEPFLTAGNKINFTKCFDRNEIQINTVIMFDDGDNKRIAVVKNINGNMLELFQPNRAENKINDITMDEVAAIFDEKYGGEIPQNNDTPIEQQNTNEWQNIKSDKISLQIPASWQLTSQDNDVFIVKNINEPGFQTYFSLSKDNLNGQTLNTYFASLKQNIREKTPGISFSNENSTKINNRDALAVEGELRQQNMDFKILIVAIKSGQGDDVWIFSFNSQTEDWNENDDVFVRILNNFNPR
jgi:hypothetical protein